MSARMGKRASPRESWFLLQEPAKTTARRRGRIPLIISNYGVPGGLLPTRKDLLSRAQLEPDPHGRIVLIGQVRPALAAIPGENSPLRATHPQDVQALLSRGHIKPVHGYDPGIGPRRQSSVGVVGDGARLRDDAFRQGEGPGPRAGAPGYLLSHALPGNPLKLCQCPGPR